MMLGGPKKIADLLGFSTGAVTKWYADTRTGGCGGLIPSRHIVTLCKYARARGKFLEPNMFFTGHV